MKEISPAVELSDQMSAWTLLVTGATSGIGRAIAFVAAKRGARVIAHARNRERYEDLLNSGIQGNVTEVIGDLLTPEGRKAVEEAILTERPEMLILNAGYNCRKANTSEWTNEEIDQMLSVNLLSPIECARTFAALPSRDQARKLAFILSSSCQLPRSQMALYVAAKSGLMGFGRVMQQEADALGMRTTLFYPGRVDTGFRDTSHPEYMDPFSVAKAVLDILMLPDDLIPYEFTFRPSVDKLI